MAYLKSTRATEDVAMRRLAAAKRGGTCGWGHLGVGAETRVPSAEVRSYPPIAGKTARFNARA